MFYLTVFERVLRHAYVADVRLSRICHKPFVYNIFSEAITLKRAILTVSAIACPSLIILGFSQNFGVVTFYFRLDVRHATIANFHVEFVKNFAKTVGFRKVLLGI